MTTAKEMGPMWLPFAIKMIDMVATIVTNWPALEERFQKSRQVSENAKAQGRDPTPEEWAALDADTDRLVSEILDAEA